MSQAEKFWNSSANNYDKTEERFEYIHQRSRDNAKRHLRRSDIVLDYGCGTGTTSCEVAPLVEELHAIDISSEMVSLAREKAAAGGIENVTFEQVDIFDERFEEGSFDAVLAFNVLHTVPDSKRAVQRMHELLKPEGVLISVTPCFRDKASFLVRLQLLFVRMLCVVGLIPIPIRSVGSADLDDLMANSGSFQVVDAEKIFRGASSYFLVAKKTNKNAVMWRDCATHERR